MSEKCMHQTTCNRRKVKISKYACKNSLVRDSHKVSLRIEPSSHVATNLSIGRCIHKNRYPRNLKYLQMSLFDKP